MQNHREEGFFCDLAFLWNQVGKSGNQVKACIFCKRLRVVVLSDLLLFIILSKSRSEMKLRSWRGRFSIIVAWCRRFAHGRYCFHGEGLQWKVPMGNSHGGGSIGARATGPSHGKYRKAGNFLPGRGGDYRGGEHNISHAFKTPKGSADTRE